MSEQLLDILACPVCKGPLKWLGDTREYLCRPDRLAFPVQDGIPVMLPDQARRLSAEDPALAGR